MEERLDRRPRAERNAGVVGTLGNGLVKIPAAELVKRNSGLVKRDGGLVGDFVEGKSMAP